MNAREREKRSEPLILSDFKELPDWLIEVRKEFKEEDLPVFSYYFSDYRLTPYLLDIYADGHVNITFNFIPYYFMPDRKGTLLTKVSPKTVKKFLKDLKKLDFNQWKLYETQAQFCDKPDPCIWTYAQATHKEGNKIRKVMIEDPAYLADLDGHNKGAATRQIAKLNTLIERYFPTQKIRCELGSSEGFKKACIERDNRWALIAKESK
jgi:hypothetical protein